MAAMEVKIVVQVLCACILYTVSSTAISDLRSIPSTTDGIITTCVDSSVTLTCSHDNRANGITRWLFSDPINCAQTIDHNPPILTDSCGPFQFQNITEIGSNGLLNSTAITNVSSSMSGTVIECRDSSGTVFNTIGRVSLCIIDGQLNLRVANQEDIVWDSPSCVPAGVVQVMFKVELVGADGDGSEMVYTFLTNDTFADLSNFTTFQNYTATVIPVLGNICSGTSATISFTREELIMSLTSTISTSNSKSVKWCMTSNNVIIAIVTVVSFIVCVLVKVI